MMFYDIPISAIFICYGPLLLTIFGFIAFAYWTDINARRTYLRRLDLRTEEEKPAELPPLITDRVTARTPSGSKVTLVPPLPTSVVTTSPTPPDVTTTGTTIVDEGTVVPDDTTDDDESKPNTV